MKRTAQKVNKVKQFAYFFCPIAISGNRIISSRSCKNECLLIKSQFSSCFWKYTLSFQNSECIVCQCNMMERETEKRKFVRVRKIGMRMQMCAGEFCLFDALFQLHVLFHSSRLIRFTIQAFGYIFSSVLANV